VTLPRKERERERPRYHACIVAGSVAGSVVASIIRCAAPDNRARILLLPLHGKEAHSVKRSMKERERRVTAVRRDPIFPSDFKDRPRDLLHINNGP
jgi:hypothetical protein